MTVTRRAPPGPGIRPCGWWDALIGPGRALNTDRWFVVAPNVLGGCQGSTGPSSRRPDGTHWGGDFPYLTIRDQVVAEAQLADALGIGRWAAVIGGSMGGMRALEWAVSLLERTGSLLVLAAPAASSAEQIAWGSTQIAAIRSDPGWRGGGYHDAPPGSGPHQGLGLARRIAHVTYRSEPELAARFGRRAQPGELPSLGGRYQVESYLDHHAAKLVRRFDAGSYVVLTEAMNAHDVGRGRGGVARALRRADMPALIAGIDSDRLYPCGAAGGDGGAAAGCRRAPDRRIPVRARRVPDRDRPGGLSRTGVAAPAPPGSPEPLTPHRPRPRPQILFLERS